jgi:hypothetical protein
MEKKSRTIKRKKTDVKKKESKSNSRLNKNIERMKIEKQQHH